MEEKKKKKAWPGRKSWVGHAVQVRSGVRKAMRGLGCFIMGLVPEREGGRMEPRGAVRGEVTGLRRTSLWR